MLKRILILLSLLFALNKPVYSAAEPFKEEVLPAATTIETDSTYEQEKKDLSIESILSNVESIKEQEQLEKLLNLLYLQRELLNIFVAEKAAQKTMDDDSIFDKISSEIIQGIKTLKNELTPQSLQILENLEEYLTNNAELCFSCIFMFFDLREHFCTYFIKTRELTNLLIKTISPFKAISRSSTIVKFFEQKHLSCIIGTTKLPDDYKYLDASSFNPDQINAYEEYFNFFESLDLNALQEDTNPDINEGIRLIKNMHPKINLFAKLFRVSQAVDSAFKQSLCSLFGLTKHEEIYNLVYKKIYERCIDKKIKFGPDRGKNLSETLFEKFHSEIEIRTKIICTAATIDNSSIIMGSSKKSQLLGSTVTPSGEIKNIVLVIKFAYSNPNKLSPLNGYLKTMMFDIKDWISANKISASMHTPEINKFVGDKNPPQIWLAKTCLYQYFIFLKQKYESELHKLEMHPISKTKTDKKKKQSKKSYKPKTNPSRKVKPIRPEIAPTSALAPIPVKATIIEAPTKATKPKLKSKNAPQQSETNQSRPIAPHYLGTLAAQIEQNLYAQELVIKETPEYKIIAKSWGAMPSDGCTVILYNSPPNGTAPGLHKNLDQVKFDIFHYIPEAIDTHYGIVISSGKEAQFNQNVRPGQQLHLTPTTFAVCVKAIVLSKFAFRHFTLKTNEQIMNLINNPSGPGFHKGAYVFLFDRVGEKRFHQCFHEFIGPVDFDNARLV